MAAVHGTDTINDMLEYGDDMQFAICTHAITVYVSTEQTNTPNTPIF